MKKTIEEINKMINVNQSKSTFLETENVELDNIKYWDEITSQVIDENLYEVEDIISSAKKSGWNIDKKRKCIDLIVKSIYEIDLFLFRMKLLKREDEEMKNSLIETREELIRMEIAFRKYIIF